MKSFSRIAADANVLLPASVAGAAQRVFLNAPDLTVVTTDVNVAEVEEYLPAFAARYGLNPEEAMGNFWRLPFEIYTAAEYGDHLAQAGKYLEGRDPDDIALAALAMKLKTPIWSNDKDFRVIPVELFTTARLLKVLGL